MTDKEKKNKIISYVGFAKKCGGIAVGTDGVLAEVRRSGAAGRICVVTASDASERTLKQIKDKCSYYGVTLIVGVLTGDETARAAGKKMTVSAVAITDMNLASAVISIADQSGADDTNDPDGGDEQFNERIFPHESGK